MQQEEKGVTVKGAGTIRFTSIKVISQQPENTNIKKEKRLNPD